MPPEGRYNFRHYGPVPLSFDPVRHLPWTYQGWQGQVYTRQYPENKFVQECLREYCQYEYQGEPLFRTVGNDATFYRPPTANQLRRYLSQIPEDFQMCFKVWEEITIPSYAKQPRYGARAGQPNPWFLDAKLFNELVLTPFREASFVFRCRTGCGMLARYASRASRGPPNPCFNVLRLLHM